MNIYTLLFALLAVVHMPSQANIATHNQVTETVQIHWVDASNLAKIMTAIVQMPNSHEIVPLVFTANPETNSIAITGQYDYIIKAKQVILELDIPRPIVHLEVFTGEAKEKVHQETLAYLKNLLEQYKQNDATLMP